MVASPPSTATPAPVGLHFLTVLALCFATATHGLSPSPASSICAVGDLHGDLDHALAALRLCNVIDHAGQWSGGSATVVQTGDVVDRGNESLPLLHHLWSLQEQAAAAGGELLLMMGNHELLNMQGATHYVHPDEMLAFGGTGAWRKAMHPTIGEIGQRLVRQPGVAVRGEGACRTLFLHAGLRLAVGAKYGSLEAINHALREQVTANSGGLLDSRQGPLWFRGYARPHAAGLSEEEACAEVRATVASLGDGAKRMAVGHNIVPFVSTRCAGALQMIDVGMSSAYEGRPAAWRCEADPDGGATIKALYLEGEEPPPDLCTACELARRGSVHPRGGDTHDDCPNYCQRTSRRTHAAAGGGGGPGGASWASMLLGQVGGGAAEPAAPAAGNHVKTEF